MPLERASRKLQSVDDDERATRDADPAYLSPDYVGTRLRSPRRPLLLLPQRLSELTGPAFGSDDVRESDSDLTMQRDGEPLGERIIVSGRVLGSDGRPVRSALIEIWQANAAGRYRHRVDQHPAPLDPNFTGGGRVLTDDEGRYRFITIKPGAYPWKNHHNAWRPAHIHLSVFGRAFTERLVTQMYFPGDPLFAYDPIYQSVRDPQARERMISTFDLANDEARVGARLQLRRRARRQRRDAAGERVSLPRTPSQTVGPFFEFGLLTKTELVESGAPARSGSRAGCSTAPASPCPTAWSRSGRPTRTGATRAAPAGVAARPGPDGGYAFTTVKPGAVREPDGTVQAPHVSVLCFARGLLKPVLTRLYFPDEAEANAADPVLGAIGDDGERATLVATRGRPASYRFDIRLQGDGQTVFFTTPASGL